MAEQNEEIIIIEDSDAAAIERTSDENVEIVSSSTQADHKSLYIAIGAGIFVVLVAILTLFIYKKLNKHESIIEPESISKKEQKDMRLQEVAKPSKLENMIAKANYLYSKGSKSEALSLYENIAIYNEAISAYNLGVAQMKQAQYSEAIASFKRAMVGGEHRCVSAINAAVCSLHLDDQDSFRYYIDLANAYLPRESSSPLYSYYYTLVNYYRSNYLSALGSLKNPTTDAYAKTQNLLLARISSLLGDDATALEETKKLSGSNSYSIGLLHARLGDLSSAKMALSEARSSQKYALKAKTALSFVDLKLGDIASATSNIESVNDELGEAGFDEFPIKVRLKDELFDPAVAEKNYRQVLSKSRSLTYQKIFYFSSYKVFDAQKSIEYIRKGSTSAFVENSDLAQEYLAKSMGESSINKQMVESIKKALNFEIRPANRELEALVKKWDRHSILHYNLALTYAQLNDMSKAHYHFLRSYNLDAKNYQAGLYAILTAQLIHKDSKKLMQLISEDLLNEPSSKSIDLYKTIYFIAQDNYIAAYDTIHSSRDHTLPLNSALEAIIALMVGNYDLAVEASEALVKLLPFEIVPHAIYTDAHFGSKPQKEFARELLSYNKRQNYEFRDLYYGPFLTRMLYTQQNLITGQMYFLIKQLKEALLSTKYPHEITSSLALALLYGGEMEESFVQYNNLIDNLGVSDTQTLFLASVASIAADHHENAMALLELAKIQESSYLESRYALALLYLEARNPKGASTTLAKIGDSFKSQFFDFNIDTAKLLEQKLKQE